MTWWYPYAKTLAGLTVTWTRFFFTNRG